jgi:hypothetical protein
MLSGVMLLWFILTAASVLFVVIDIQTTPESPLLKWGFVLLTLYTGPIGSFLYVLGCREPLPNTHEQYVSATWRQVLGSTMHCVAGDGVGILAGAVIGWVLVLAAPAEIALEYALGFGFGWIIFQALFMRDMVGGSFLLSMRKTFLPELLSMNCLMGGMVALAAFARARVPAARDVATPEFWFVMSMALLLGFCLAFPINWWLVTRHLKHGMMTIRLQSTALVGRTDIEVSYTGHSGSVGHTRNGGHAVQMSGDRHSNHSTRHRGMSDLTVTTAQLAGMTLLSVIVLVSGLAYSQCTTY